MAGEGRLISSSSTSGSSCTRLLLAGLAFGLGGARGFGGGGWEGKASGGFSAGVGLCGSAGLGLGSGGRGGWVGAGLFWNLTAMGMSSSSSSSSSSCGRGRVGTSSSGSPSASSSPSKSSASISSVVGALKAERALEGGSGAWGNATGGCEYGNAGDFERADTHEKRRQTVVPS